MHTMVENTGILHHFFKRKRLLIIASMLIRS